MPFNNIVYNLRWLILMAWRDSRRNKSRMLLFGSSIILGIAAQVAIYSLGDNLRRNIDLQAATLLGADLEISGGKPPTDVITHIIDSVAVEKSEERSFASMIYFPGDKGTRLVQVRAIQGNYPYYGTLETLPEDAQKTFRSKRAALLDKSLMMQYGVKEGDSVALGELKFVVEGSLSRAPGQTGLSASIAPVVYIPLNYLEETGLLQKGSRINYKNYIRFKPQIDAGQLVKRIESRLDIEGFYFDTIETQKEDTGRSFEDLTEYLQLVGFIALLLGCIGVASAVHIYVREKIAMVAILRCLGAKSSQAFMIFLIQVLAIGTMCSVIGAFAGSLIQGLLPLLLEDFIPFKIVADLSWSAIGQGIALGILITVLFALLPLIDTVKISPLNTLRMSFQENRRSFNPFKWIMYVLILLFVYFFMYLQLGNWQKSAVFLGGIMVTFLLLAAVASLLMWIGRRFFPQSWSYVVRQGILNLYRPNNQTRVLILSIGFGAAVVSTLFLVQSILINRVSLSASGNQPNIVLFDIQSQQKDEVLNIARRHNLPVKPTVPIVNMRLEQVNGVTALDVQEDTTKDMSMRLYSREYRVTFRDTISDSEKVTDGRWHGNADVNSGDIYISVEKGFASRFDLKIGDTMVFNVQGAIVSTIIGSTREVDWNRIQANFIIVFPKGVLEDAPQFHVYMAHIPSDEVSVRFQQDVVRRFPNVSIIDLALVLSVLEEIMEKIAFVIRFIAAFSIITGLVVLIISVLISKYQRVRENVLLRTLGASGKQILTINALEYLFLGSMAAAAGILLSLCASWALARFTFDTVFTPALLPIGIIFISICVLTVVIGVVNSRGILNKPPLEVLRHEI